MADQVLFDNFSDALIAAHRHSRMVECGYAYAVRAFDNAHTLVAERRLAVFNRAMPKRPLDRVGVTTLDHAAVPVRGDQRIVEIIEKNLICHKCLLETANCG